MSTKQAIFIIRLEPPGDEAEWIEWFINAHRPARLAVPGFLFAHRFITDEKPRYLHLFGLASRDVMYSDTYKALKEREATMPYDSFEAKTSRSPQGTRGLYEPIFPKGVDDYLLKEARFLFAVGADIIPEHEAEYNAWYNTEHFPRLLKVPGFLGGQRLMITPTPPSGKSAPPASAPKYIGLYAVENEGVLRSEAFNVARATPWGTWMKNFYKVAFRCVYKRLP